MSFEAFIAEAYVQLVATDLKCYAQALRSETSYCYCDRVTLSAVRVRVRVCRTVLCGALYTACILGPFKNRTTTTTESIQEMGEDNNTIPLQTLINIIVLIMTFIANIKSSLQRIQHFWEKTTQAVKEATSTMSRRDLPTQNRGNNRKNHPNSISPENDFRMMSTMSCTSRTHQ